MKYGELGKLFLGVALGSMLGLVVYQSSRISFDRRFQGDTTNTSSSIDPCVGAPSCTPECGCANCGSNAEICACDPTNTACSSSSADPCATDSCTTECACNCGDPYLSCVCELGDPAACGSSLPPPPPPPPSSPSSSAAPSSTGSSDPCASSAAST